MRLLLIEHDARFRSLIRHHVSCEWPGAEFVGHNHAATGMLPPEFLAQGFDAVLLDHAWSGGEGLAWLQDLAARPGFAPIVFLSERTDDDTARRARVFGAFGVIAKQRVDHDEFMDVLREASRTQQRQMADWRVSEAAEASRRFGAVRIPGYRCIRRLAGGSVSQLYLAESEKAGTLIVVKVTPSMRDESGIDQSFERFLQEYEIARRLHHSNIVRCHELGVADDHAYLAMEYFPDGDLRRRMRGGVGAEDALQLAMQMARALQALHDAGTLHRDLKPGNVLMRGANRLALTDFGLAKHLSLEFEITDPGLIFGTPHYMSPEQGHGQDVDTRTDLYSLGVILYEMLMGEKPYTDANPMAIIYKHRNAPIPRLRESLSCLQDLVDRLLAKQPKDRFASAVDAERALAQALMQLKGIAA
jgi:tRNA A-37 threonylcarbamoyl transferase component Bud32/DNA-binding response OmpR family regulator